MKFSNLPIGSKFQIQPNGSIRTKITQRNYETVGMQHGSSEDAEVTVVEAAPAMVDLPVDPSRPWEPAGPRVVVESDGSGVLDGQFKPWQLLSLVEAMRRWQQE